MPENWKQYRLGDLIEVNKNSIRKGDLDWINYIDIKSAGTGFYEEPKRMNFEDAPSRARRLLKEGDTVISSVRPNLKSYFYSQNLKDNTIASTGFAVLTPKKIDNRFLYYLTTNDNYINYLVQSCTGSAYPAFGPKVLLDSEVLIPESLQEQKSIASILSALDDKIELNLQMNKTLEEMALALYRHWFVDFGPFQDGEFVESELGEIPKGWEVLKIGDFTVTTDYVANGSFKSLKDNVTTFDSSEYGLYIRLVDFNNGFSSNLKYVDKKSFDFLQKSKINGKEIVISNVGANAGTVFRPPTWLNLPMTLGSNSIMIKENDYTEILYQYFLSYYGQEALKNIMSGSAQPKFNKTDFRNMKVTLPDPFTFSIINNKLSTIQESITQNKAENQTLTQLRDTLLPKLISGEVRMKDVEKTLSEVL